MTPTLLRFNDLRERGIANNWVTLGKWIKYQGFPQGRLLGPNTRVWTEEEIAQWIAERPTARRDGKPEAA